MLKYREDTERVQALTPQVPLRCRVIRPPEGPGATCADTVLAFARTLRHAGVAASPDRIEAMLEAVGALDVLDAIAVYWAWPAALCGGPR